MIKLRSSTKYVIVIAVFFVSVAIGLQRSKLHKSFGEQQTVLDVKTAQDLFDKSPHFKKIRMGFRPADFQKTKSAITSELNNELITRKYWDSTGQYIVLVSEIPDSLASSIVSNLRNINGLVEDKIFTDSNQDIEINVEEHLKNKQLVKERLKTDLSNPNRRMTEQSVASAERSLSKLQTEIDSLSNQVKIHKQRKERNLLFLTAVNAQTGNRFMKSLQEFIFTTILMLIVLTVGLLIFYFIMVMFLKLMKKLGIRTAQGTGNYSYNYNKYYGYGAKNKRIKRIYKDKKTSDEEEESK
jgi:hypothetical protein